MDITNIKWSPAIPINPPFDVQKRIEELRSYLDPNNPDREPERQHVNIKAVIKLYEDGKIDGIKSVFVMNGKIVSREEIFHEPSWVWMEGLGHQRQLKHAYGQGPFNPGFHEIRMLLRLIPELGGDGTVYGIIAMNDTGSDLLSLFSTDFLNLGRNIQGYFGWYGRTNAVDANGVITAFPRILVQVKLVRDDNTPWSDWIEEIAIVRQPGPNVARLSGAGIRDAFYIGTAPGNHLLAVSATLGGLASLL